LTDVEVVRECLKHWRSFALGLRYAGLGKKLHETEQALEALERIERPALFEMEVTDGKEEDETAYSD